MSVSVRIPTPLRKLTNELDVVTADSGRLRMRGKTLGFPTWRSRGRTGGLWAPGPNGAAGGRGSL